MAGLIMLAPVSAWAQVSSTLPAAPTPNATTSGSTGTTGVAAGGGAQTPSLGGSTGGFPVQVPSQSSSFNPYLGSVQSGPAVPRDIPLTLDDAFKMGIANNLGLVYAKQGEVQNQSQRLQALNVLLPNIDVSGGTAFHQYNLQAEGFRPGLIAQLGPVLGRLGGGGGGGGMASFPSIVKVDVTQGQATFSQYLFDWEGYDLIKAVGHLVKSSVRNSASSRGQVVENVGIAYLRVIAARSQVDYDQAVLATDQIVLYQTEQEHQAGTVANLDELRARVQLQTQQQAVIVDQNTLAKAKIALNRSIGLAPEQEIAVADAAPFPNLEAMTPEAAEAEALRDRQDFASASEQLEAASLERKAATRERVPTLQFNADYGVQGVSGGIYHGVFTALGTLNIPIFEEARFQADRDTAEYQLETARAQVANLRDTIRQQVRDDLINLRAAEATVTVARSNADLSRVALDQARQRFQAGIEDNLPTIEAESTLAQSDVQFVNATFQVNQTKLTFARDLGMIDVDFHPEWQGGRPAGVQSDRAAMGK